jgi:hypothetical protein
MSWNIANMLHVRFAPYAAGLYTNNRFGTEWFVLFGAALCGISAGVFWMAEAAIAIGKPHGHRPLDPRPLLTSNS